MQLESLDAELISKSKYLSDLMNVCLNKNRQIGEISDQSFTTPSNP